MNFQRMLCVVLACGLLACGQPPSPTAVDGGLFVDAGAPLDAGLDAGQVAAELDGGAVEDAGFDAGARRMTMRRGFVQLTQTVVDAGVAGVIAVSVVSAVFAEMDECSVETLGPCRLTTCMGSSTERPAGLISLEGSSLDGGVRLDLSASGSASAVRSDRLWTTPGQQLTLRSSGSTVPAFVVTLTSDEALTFSQSPCPAGTCPPQPRTEPLRLEWQDVSASTSVVFRVAAASGLLECEAPATAGSLVVPAEALGRFPPGNVSVAWQSLSHVVGQAGDWTVDASASEGLRPTLTMELR